MTTITRLIFSNWPLKVTALGLAHEHNRDDNGNGVADHLEDPANAAEPTNASERPANKAMSLFFFMSVHS